MVSNTYARFFIPFITFAVFIFFRRRYGYVGVCTRRVLLSICIATGINNVPIFIKADNAEKEIESFLSSR